MKKTSKESCKMAHYISDWLNVYVPSQKTCRDNTLKSYTYALSLYIGFLEMEKNVEPSALCPECFCRTHIEEWLVWLIDVRNCSPETCNNRLASLRAFLRYLGVVQISLMYLSQDASQIPRKKTYRKKVNGLGRKGMQALLYEPDQSTRTGRRDLTLLTVMYNTAVRIDEILSLKVRHLNLDCEKPNITVVGKGSKIRTLYLLPRTVSHMKRYLLEFHGKEPLGGSYVFYSRNTGLQGKMSQTAVNKQLKKYAASAHLQCNEVPVDLHAHQIRHAKASHWLEDGMNIVQISFLLGHEQLQTTMVYLDITLEQELKALQTLEDENDKKVSKKWENVKGGLAEFCGVKLMKK